MSDTTEVLADYLATIDYSSLPSTVIELVKRQCIDLIGVALAGSLQPAGRIAAASATRATELEGASTIWGGSHTSTPDAAFANGVAAHALDYDDIWLPGSHPSAPIVPAAFAVAESEGASGKDLIVALVAGYEAMGRLHGAASTRAGWHPTGVFGTFGAAAATARLLGCSASQIVMALGIASSATSGIDGHEGTMTKPFHAGQSARNGVFSAHLAADGFTASGSVFDDGGHGFFEAFFRGVAVDRWRITAGLGTQYWIENPGIGIKMQPAGYYMLQTFEAALKIVEEHDLQPEQVASVEIGVRPETRFDRAIVRSGLEGKFSLQYMATMAIVHRGLDVDSFSEALVSSEAIRATMRKVRTRPDRSLPVNSALSFNPVTITCTDGRVFTEAVVQTRSHWEFALARADWLEKFERNAGMILDSGAVEQLTHALDSLEEVTDVREVAAMLARRREDEAR